MTRDPERRFNRQSGSASPAAHYVHRREVRLFKMCGCDNISVHYVCSLLQEINNRNAPGDELGVMRPDDSRLLDPDVMLPCVASEFYSKTPTYRFRLLFYLSKFIFFIFLGKSETVPEQTREELTAKVRLARERRRNNDEAAVTKTNISLPENTKQPCKFQTKNLGRNINKDKRTLNYAFSRRE